MALKTNQNYLDELVQDTEPASEDGRYVSEEEYWKKYYEHLDFNYEWNNGILEEKFVSDYKNLAMYQWLFVLLNHYLQTFKVGKIVDNDFGFRLALPDKVSIRKPDLAVVLTKNQIGLFDDDRSFKGIYDLCIELISDLTRKAIKRDTEDKKQEYETIGVKEYYILDATNRYMAFYRLSDRGIFEPITLIEGDILRSEVLKGFQLRVSDLFRQPLMEEIAEDPVYQDFVFPNYKKFKQRAEAEKQRADEEKKRAEAEKQRADYLAARLRELGIYID
jgi:hypothetical protein